MRKHYRTESSSAFSRVMQKLSDIDDKAERDRQIDAMRRAAAKRIAAEAQRAKPRWKKRLKKLAKKILYPFGEH
jgi:polyribonucleotide nucleotidyltransferase